MQQQRIVEDDAAPEAERGREIQPRGREPVSLRRPGPAPPVAAAPSTVNSISSLTREPLRSAIAPSTGASNATQQAGEAARHAEPERALGRD